jgi:hypothetical protein
MEGRGGEDIYRFETRPYNLERDFGWAIDRLQANHLRSINLSLSETDTILDFSAQDLIEFEDSVTRVSSSTAPSALKSGELLIAPVTGGTALYIGRDQTVGVDLTVLLPGIQPASLTLQSDGMKLKIGSSVDTTPPQIALSANRLELKADEIAQIQFTLSEPVNDFTLSDVAVSGGSLTGLSGSGASYTATFTPAPNSDATVAMLSVADGFVSDAAGLFNQDGGSATNALLINIDTQTPRLTAVSPADQASNVPINSNLVFTFSEAVQRSNGSITLTHASDPSANRSFSVTDTSQVSIDRNTLIINPVELLKPNAQYAITMSPGALSDLAGNPFSGLRAADGYDFHTASASSMGALEGIAYHWRSHELLESVNVMVAEEVAPLGSNLVAPIRFVPIRWDAAGQATMEVWSHPTLASESFDLQIRIEGANSIDFTPGQALSGWVVESNSVGGRLDAGGFAISASQGLTTDPTPIGTLTFETTAIDRTTLHLDYGAAGALVGTAFSQTLARADTDPNGEFIIGDLDLGLYQLSATRAPLTVASSITSADALATLKMSVGRNPNVDPDGAGPVAPPRVSPYQFIAAEVTGDGRVTAADARAVLRMATEDPLAPAPRWLFIEEGRDFWDESANGGSGAFTTSRHAVAPHGRSLVSIEGGASTVNLVGLVLGDVDGSWTAAAGATDLDVVAPSYLSELSALLGTPLDQWVV